MLFDEVVISCDDDGYFRVKVTVTILQHLLCHVVWGGGSFQSTIDRMRAPREYVA